MALGATGAWIGTRFLASHEAAIHPRYRERLLQANENDTIFLENLFDIRWPNAPHRAVSPPVRLLSEVNPPRRLLGRRVS